MAFSRHWVDPRRHIQLVEAYRDGEGRLEQRTVAMLGRLNKLNSELESVNAISVKPAYIASSQPPKNETGVPA